MKNHYEALGISRNAAREEIKSAYRKLSVKFHPDNNNGDAYFEALFKDIQEAYETLSDENKRATYDKKLNSDSIALDTTTPKAINKTQVIAYFETDKDSFEEGESIKLSWRTVNADKVIIKPFGEVEKTGTMIFKPKNFNKKNLSVTLQATNTLFDETVSKTLKIKNLVTEIDFYDLDKEQSQDTESNSSVEPEEPVMANAMAGTISDAPPRTEDHIETFFSINGRLRRSTYIGRAILMCLPILLLSLMAESSNDESLYTILRLLGIFCCILVFMQFIKRLHDINLSGWWGLLNIIRGVFGLVVIFIDSNRGPNHYDPDPKNRN